MSRIGKRSIPVPTGVTVEIKDKTITAKGGKGELQFVANDEVIVSLEDNAVVVMPRNDSKDARSKWGMTRTMIANIISGVKDGVEKRLEISGVGYRAAMQGKQLQLSLGLSHEVLFEAPEDISISVPKPTEVVVSGVDVQRVGQTAAKIREYRSPEPYKGKGIRYAGEYIVRKEGKKK